MYRLKERYGNWALVTGATSGTGEQFARLLAKNHINLVLVARGEENLKQVQEELQQEYGIEVRRIVADLSRSDSITVINELTRGMEIGLLINNAGYSMTGEFLQLDWEKQRELLETNLRAPFELSYLFGSRMIKQGKGGIIFVSSSVAYTPMPLWSIYSSSKAALLSFGESLSYELKSHGIDVLTVCPGAMKTKFSDRAGIKTIAAMDPKLVVLKTLQSLGNKNVIMPGVTNRIIFQGLGRFLPRTMRLFLFANLMKYIRK